MGSSMGCVRPQREDLSGAPPLSPKKRLRFKRKRKGRKGRKGEVAQEESGRRGSHDPDPRDQEEEEGGGEKASLLETTDSKNTRLCFRGVPDPRLGHFMSSSNTLAPGCQSVSMGGSSLLEVTPKPSPAWRGVFCLPGQEDTVSAIVELSSLPGQTPTTRAPPASIALGTTNTTSKTPQGSTTPGGGRVCRVKEKVQGVLEKPWILRPKKEKKEKGRAKQKQEVKEAGGAGGGRTGRLGGGRGGGTAGGGGAQTALERERKGVIHIREADGKLCVVRTVYPSDYGSPVWRGDVDEVEVRAEPPAPSPVTGNVLTVQLSEDDDGRAKMADPRHAVSAHQTGNRETKTAHPFDLDTPLGRLGGTSLLESGYASDLLLTSPGTGGTTPSQTDWGGLTTSSSSERVDSMVESPLSPLQQAPVKHLPQVWKQLPTSLSVFLSIVFLLRI